MKKIKIYVGCSLTHAPQEYRDQITELKRLLGEIPYVEILEFHSDPNTVIDSVPADVYEHDIHNCCERASIFIAEVSYPSTGIGWELCKCVEMRRIPTLICQQRNMKVTKLVRGASEHKANPHVDYLVYRDVADIVSLLRNKILPQFQQAA